MPKSKRRESVVYSWVGELTFQMQALLFTSMRGPDACSKDNPAKSIVRYLRGAVLKPAGRMIIGENDNSFMWTDYHLFTKCSAAFWDDHDEYPHHFIMHLVHCAEVVGYKHPVLQVRQAWKAFYYNACISFHMHPETEKEMDERLNDFKS